MKISVIGGGPGGLYFSILTKKALPHCEITVYERNKPDDSFGFGVVFSDETLSEFLTRDPQSYELIRTEFAYWDELDVARDGEKVRITGNGFCGCSRKKLLQLLHQRCREEKVQLQFETEVDDLSVFSDSDVIVACDGIGSSVRTRFANEFGTEIRPMQNRFVWMGSTRPLDAFTYFFRSTPHGMIVAHTYQYEPGMSTWIFECSDETWEKWGFDVFDEQDTINKLQEIFKEELDGHPLITNKSHWRQFPHVTNKNWYHNNIVLLGDAKATAHYSIGSGTKLAMECAIALSDAIVSHPGDIVKAFELYEKKRRNRVEMIQHAALVSLDWFEHMDRHSRHPFDRFAFGVMTRAKKVTYENLQLRDRSFTNRVLEAFQKEYGFNSPSPAFTPFQLGTLTIPNRIVMSSMGQYQAKDGEVNDWHKIHYGSRAIGGVGLIMTEMTAVSGTGRITLGCTGIYSKNQVFKWREITDFVHQNTDSVIGIQLGHSGRKGAVCKPWEGNQTPLPEPWELLSASPIAFHDSMPVPKEMTQEDMDRVTREFVQAAINAHEAGFDLVELQAHHGFLLASFLSPLTNIRTDEYGGSVENRLRFPLRVFTEMRAAFPKSKPMTVRISASDWAQGGITEADVMAIAQGFKNAGADAINVSTGNTVSYQKPAMGRMWQVPFSDAVRNTVGITSITSGAIADIDQVNTIILNGKADLVALGRPLLINPGWVRQAQAHEGIEPSSMPLSYLKAKDYLWHQEQSGRRNTEGMKLALKPQSHEKK